MGRASACPIKKIDSSMGGRHLFNYYMTTGDTKSVQFPRIK